MIREFDCKVLGFKGFKTIIIKSALRLLVHHNNESFTNHDFILDILSKDKFLFSVSKPLSRCSECVPLIIEPILMVDYYWNP